MGGPNRTLDGRSLGQSHQLKPYCWNHAHGQKDAATGGIGRIGAIRGSIGATDGGPSRSGFFGGEWREVPGTPKMQMYIAILTLIVATIVLAYGNTMAEV